MRAQLGSVEYVLARLLTRFRPAYFLAHREYIHDTYGHSEDLELDEMAFIYGQDCTSDWACAVMIEANRGSKVEFEVFSLVNSGVWGEWKTACSASQRGPHRERSTSSPSAATTNMEEEEPSRIPDQAIVIKRLTIQTRRFRSMKLHAFAEPKSDGNGRREADDSMGNRLTSSDWHDPLSLVHEYLLDNSSADFSLASDDDALMLLKLVGRWESYSELKIKLWQKARMHATIHLEEDSVAALHFKSVTTSPIQPHRAKYMNSNHQHHRNHSSLDISKSIDGLTT